MFLCTEQYYIVYYSDSYIYLLVIDLLIVILCKHCSSLHKLKINCWMSTDQISSIQPEDLAGKKLSTKKNRILTILLWN